MTLTRRRLLGALAVVGGVGAFEGRETRALLGDPERSGGVLTTGGLDLNVAYWDVSATDAPPYDPAVPDGVGDGQRLTLPVTLDGPDRPGQTLVRFSLPQSGEAVNSPASLWLRTVCPAATTLGELLRLRVSYATASGVAGATIADGSLREVANRLRGGARLDGDGDPSNGLDCLTDEVFLLFEYDLDGYVGSESLLLVLETVALQCRGRDPNENPFPADVSPCVPGYACDCCWTIGKVEADSPLRAGETYEFDEGLTDYAISVSDIDGEEGVAFELVSPAGMPVLPLCSVTVTGGPTAVDYGRRDDGYGTATAGLDGAVDGLAYAPTNPNTGGRYAISHLLVSVCTPVLGDGTCPEAVAGSARRQTDPHTADERETVPAATQSTRKDR